MFQLGPLLPPKRSGARLHAALAGACAVITFLVFLPVLRNGFVETWDDAVFVTGNPVLREAGTAVLREAFFGTKAHYFAPLTWLSYVLDHRLWGMDPVGFHLTSALLHALNAGLVFLVARRLFALPAAGVSERAGLPAAALAALAWSLHPLRVETVAWATERKGVLSLFFGLAAILAYLGHVRSGASFWRSRRYGLAFGLYLCSLLSKPALVTLPLVLALLDVHPLRRFRPGGRGAVIAEKLPLLVAAGLASSHFSSTSHAELTIPLAEVGVLSRVLVALRSIWDYALDLVWPVGLGPFYLHPGAVTLGDLSFLLPSVLVLAVTAFVVARARRSPAVATAWIAFLIALAPGLMATQVSWVARADRFTYFAALPLTLLAAVLAAEGVARVGPPARRVAAAGLAAGLVLLGGLTVRQISFWRDDVTLWSRPIELAPRLSGRVYTERSKARELQGDLRGARSDMDAAIEIASSKGYPFTYTLYSRRARISAALGELRPAIDDYGRAIETDPSPGVEGTLRERAELYKAVGEAGLADADRRLADQVAGAQ
jgi:hypothetical protein